MKKIIIDTNIYSNAMRGLPKAVKVFQRHKTILFSPIVVGELLAGFKKGHKEEANKVQLRQFLSQKRVNELSLTFYPNFRH